MCACVRVCALNIVGGAGKLGGKRLMLKHLSNFECSCEYVCVCVCVCVREEIMKRKREEIFLIRKKASGADDLNRIYIHNGPNDLHRRRLLRVS